MEVSTGKTYEKVEISVEEGFQRIATNKCRFHCQKQRESEVSKEKRTKKLTFQWKGEEKVEVSKA